MADAALMAAAPSFPQFGCHKGEGDSSTSFWCLLWIEQSLSLRWYTFSILIAGYLYFYMAWFLYELFHIDAIILNAAAASVLAIL